MRHGSARVGLALALASLGPARAGLAQPASKAYVLDSGARALVALELPSGKRLGVLALAGTPAALLQSPDGARLGPATP